MNASKINRIIKSLEQFKFIEIHVEPIVVFANYRAKLSIKQPTIAIKRPYELPNYLVEYEGKNQFSIQELELMAKEILQQSR